MHYFPIHERVGWDFEDKDDEFGFQVIRISNRSMTNYEDIIFKRKQQRIKSLSPISRNLQEEKKDLLKYNQVVS